MGRRMKSRGSTKLILLIFSLCAFGDFVWSYVRDAPLPKALSAQFSVCLKRHGMHFASEKDNPKSDPDDPRELGRWVP